LKGGGEGGGGVGGGLPMGGMWGDGEGRWLEVAGGEWSKGGMCRTSGEFILVGEGLIGLSTVWACSKRRTKNTWSSSTRLGSGYFLL
jgi:hypothetical protein